MEPLWLLRRAEGFGGAGVLDSGSVACPDCGRYELEFTEPVAVDFIENGPDGDVWWNLSGAPVLSARASQVFREFSGVRLLKCTHRTDRGTVTAFDSDRRGEIDSARSRIVTTESCVCGRIEAIVDCWQDLFVDVGSVGDAQVFRVEPFTLWFFARTAVVEQIRSVGLTGIECVPCGGLS